MSEREWSRSRYWFCHFLHNRHERPAVDWSAADGTPGLPREALRRWLNDMGRRHRAAERLLLPGAVNRYAGDPAYLQSLRLLVREQQHHDRLIERWMKLADLPTSADSQHVMLAPGRVLGPRYCLSVILLDDLLDASLCRLVRENRADPSLHGLIKSLHHDRRGHISFITERLTMEFADFSAVRRNLRRLRLRGMFAARLAWTVARYRKLIIAADQRPGPFMAGNWSTFERLLEKMVPYRREALLATLRAQEHDPYAKVDLLDGPVG